ncbi:ABC transporter permease subunit [bacterium]|nr:ABC transporter permease subunit [bacterium]
MLKTIIIKEIQATISSFKFAVITILSTTLILTSFFIMTNDYLARLENYEILQPQDNDPTALIKPTPLSIFAKGLDENLCRSYQIHFGGQIIVGSKQQSVNSIFQFFTTPDLLFVIKVIMGLAAMLFAFDAIVGEKESGSLKLALSNSVSRPIWILGKWLGGFISLIVPFILALLIGFTIIQIHPDIVFSSTHLHIITLMLIISIIYLAVFYSIGFMISSLTQQTSASLVLSLFTWTLVVFILPNLGNILAKQLAPLPSVSQLEQQKDQIWIKEVFERIQGRTDPGMIEKNINNGNNRLMENYRMKFNRRTIMSKNITRLSPASAFTFIAIDLAGTGLLEERHVKQAILTYKDLIFGNDTDSDGNITGITPAFSFHRLSISSRLNSETLANIGILIIFNFIFFSAAYVAFLKYDIR